MFNIQNLLDRDLDSHKNWAEMKKNVVFYFNFCYNTSWHP